jgi:hypothetical protein
MFLEMGKESRAVSVSFAQAGDGRTHEQGLRRRPALISANPPSSGSVVADPDGKGQGYPTRALARQVAAVNQIPVDAFGGAVTHAALKTRVGLARTDQSEYPRYDAPLRRKVPRYAGARRREQSAGVPIIILAAEIEINPKVLAEIERHGDIDDGAIAGVVSWVVDDRTRDREPEA